MAIFRRWTDKRGYHHGRWVSAVTGRMVQNQTVARQFDVPRSAIRADESVPRRWTEIDAVYRVKVDIKGEERYVEAVRRITIHDATRREIAAAKMKARKWVRAEVKRRLGKGRLIAKERAVTGVEARRSERRTRAGEAAEVREKEAVEKGWYHDKVGAILGPVDGEGREWDMPSRRERVDANGRRHDIRTGRFL